MLLLGLLGFVPLVRAAVTWDDVVLTIRPVVLNPDRPEQSRVGCLEFRGGLELRSAHERFGGLSGLSVSRDGARLSAVTDQGDEVSARLGYTGGGRLASVADARIRPLQGLDGQPLRGKHRQDAESITLFSDDSRVVAFERQHRLWAYPWQDPGLGLPVALAAPGELVEAPINGGLEAIVWLGGGRLLALSEDLVDEGRLVAWLCEGERWLRLSYAITDSRRPSAATRLPDGDVVVMERSYRPGVGNEIRLKRIPGESIREGALLDGPVLAELGRPLSVDNYEGLDSRLGEDGREVLLYVVSDDNFNPTQRTLLLMFALMD